MEICSTHYQVDLAFLDALEEYGLIDVRIENEEKSIRTEDLKNLEKYIRLHYELDINLPGIDAIRHLQERVVSLHHEIRELQNRLGQPE